MYCEKCGAENSETAKFCRNCGADIDVEIETRVAARPKKETGKLITENSEQIYQPAARSGIHPDQGEEREVEIFSIRPTLVFVKTGYAAAAISAVMLVALVSVFLPTIVSPWVAVLFGLLLFLIPAYYHLRQKLVHYTLTDSKLEIDTGLIARTTRNVPIRRIQDVTVSATPWQRLFGIGDLVIDNASDEAGKAVLKNINTPKSFADSLLNQMRELDR